MEDDEETEKEEDAEQYQEEKASGQASKHARKQAFAPWWRKDGARLAQETAQGRTLRYIGFSPRQCWRKDGASLAQDRRKAQDFSTRG